MDKTKEWLISQLIISIDDNYISRNNVLWKLVAGFRRCGWIFAIYQNDSNYCVHSAEEWNENEEPNMGYFDKSLTYDNLICEIANRYDTLRKTPRDLHI
jgi:hypothetical protein